MKITASITLLFLITKAVYAGNAVDGINGKFDVSGGSIDSFWAENFTGSLSLPVTDHLGLQTDGLFMHTD